MTASSANDQTPHVDCVIIGVNAAATLGACISSIRSSDYPGERVHICYVDGGSTDTSVELARSFEGVEVIELDLDHPTPGKGRNAGWKAGSSPFVQFLDSDTEVTPGWLRKGVAGFTPKIAAVQGLRKEKYPLKNVFHWLTSLEWNGVPGMADSFGGDVMIRRSVLEETGGYDPVLVGGEDPDLSQRIRLAGWEILQLNTIMTRHDIAMTRVGQYWKRAYRSGYAFAAVRDRLKNQPSDFWKVEYKRILVRGGGSILLAAAGLVMLMVGSGPFVSWTALGLLAAGLGLLVYPRIFRMEAFMKTMDLDLADARLYAWHCSLVVLPDFCGVVRYFWGKWTGRPLRNKGRKLATRGQVQ